MYQIDLRTAASEKYRILHCHVSAAGYNRHLIFEKRSVACRAVGYAHPCKLLLSRHGKLTRRIAACQNNCLRFKNALFRLNFFNGAGKIHAQDLRFKALHAHFIDMLRKFHPKVKTVDPRKSRKIIHLIRIQHLTAAHIVFLYQ